MILMSRETLYNTSPLQNKTPVQKVFDQNEIWWTHMIYINFSIK